MTIGTVHFMTTLTCYKIFNILYVINWQCASSTTPVLLNSYPLWLLCSQMYEIRNEEMDTTVDAACQISEYVVMVS